MINWRKTVLYPEIIISEAIKVITKGSLQIGLVLDAEDHLLGTVTDGDIRRGIIREFSLNAPVEKIMNTSPHVARMGASDDEILSIMTKYLVHQIPLLDGNHKVVGLKSLDELIAQPKIKSNWVVLMAGGYGTRLKPLTEDTPKSLLPVGNKPILETILESFSRNSFKRFYISVNYLADSIKNHFKDGADWNVEIDYLEEQSPLGTAGALKLLPERPSEPIIVMNGDLLTRVNFQELLSFHHQQNAQATMCVREFDFQVPFGVVAIEQDQITNIDEKPIHKFFVNAGIYVLDPSTLDMIPENQLFDMTNLFQNLIDNGSKTAVFPIHEYWMDVGQAEDLNKANLEFKTVFGE
jgi:dTDP-glucose pyrophosphorylase